GDVGDVGEVGDVGDVGDVGEVGDVGDVGEVGGGGEVGEVGVPLGACAEAELTISVWITGAVHRTEPPMTAPRASACRLVRPSDAAELSSFFT
ncbi:MAG: hypothetical protein QOG49_1028, partial [Frankiaceae bacterium]|nr:hypothetical protein [Frankiaceae bacterium]